MKILTNNVAGLNQLALLRAKWGSNNIFMSCDETSRQGVLTLIHPKIRPIYLELIEDTQAIFHILVCVIKEENYLLITIYSDPDTDANAEATMNRVLD